MAKKDDVLQQQIDQVEAEQGRYELRGYKGSGKARKTVFQERTPNLLLLAGMVEKAITVGEAEYFWLKIHPDKKGGK